MAQHRASLIILIIFVGILCLRQPLNGDGDKDKELISKVCDQWSVFPETCHKCLDDVTGKDEKGLGIVSIQCSFTQSFIVIHDLDAVADSSGDPKVKLLCGRCKQIVGDAIGNIHQATINCNEDNFIGAAEHMEAASDDYSACNILVQQIPAPPSDFSDHFRVLKEDYQVSEGIMDKLSDSTI